MHPQTPSRWLLLAGLCSICALNLSLAADQLSAMPDHQSAPIVSMGSESSSALESSAALAGDDLMAAESAQPAELGAPEHKAFTQHLRQEQLAASVAPNFVVPPQQQSNAAPQVHPHQIHSQPPQAGRNLYGGSHPAHSPMQARAALPNQKMNPFIAAALAGNYGPAQQQMVAAAAGLHNQHHPHANQNQHGHPFQHGPMVHPMQQAQQQQAIPAHVQHNGGAQVAPIGQNLAVQESTVRHNVVPAPFHQAVGANSAVVGGPDSNANTIELNEAPGQPQAPQNFAVASSAQHPVVAPVGDSTALSSAWPLQAPDIPKIVNLEVKCEKNLMKVSVEFDKIFNGVIFSKGHFNQGQCIHVGQNSNKQQAYFDISINSCGTQGNTQNGLYGMGGNTGSGTYFENTIVIQYDPNVQEVYDHARKLRCTWHDQYEKAVTFRPFPVDMLDIVRADFAGDNVGCWMQIQVGKGPWASEVAGIVKIGQTMTMVLAIKDEENKFDMLVRNCFAHDGKRGPIELVDKSGCITRPKLMSKFTKIKNFGSSATVLSYAHFQAFKFPDSMEVHFQCTIQICRHQCPEQCSLAGSSSAGSLAGETYGESTIHGTITTSNAAAGGEPQHGLRKQGFQQGSALSRERRDVISRHHRNGSHQLVRETQNVGVNRIIQVVSTGDLAFAVQQMNANNSIDTPSASQLSRVIDLSNQVCMSSFNFVLGLVMLVLVLLCSSLVAVSMYLRQRALMGPRSSKLLAANPTSNSKNHMLGLGQPVMFMQRQQS